MKTEICPAMGVGAGGRLFRRGHRVHCDCGYLSHVTMRTIRKRLEAHDPGFAFGILIAGCYTIVYVLAVVLIGGRP